MRAAPEFTLLIITYMIINNVFQTSLQQVVRSLSTLLGTLSLGSSSLCSQTTSVFYGMETFLYHISHRQSPLVPHPKDALLDSDLGTGEATV